MDVKESLEKFWKECKRVIKVSRKPDKEEYFQLAKVTALGVLVIGAIGFVIVLVGTLIGL